MLNSVVCYLELPSTVVMSIANIGRFLFILYTSFAKFYFYYICVLEILNIGIKYDHDFLNYERLEIV